MSRRVTTNTEIKDKDLAIAALKQAGVMHDVSGNTIRMSSGFMAGATLDLTTGVISGDSDYGNSENFGLLRQFYGEAQFKAECLKTGIVIDERLNDNEANTVLLWHTA